MTTYAGLRGGVRRRPAVVELCTDYRPLVELARERGWLVVAANVPRRYASMVAAEGWTARVVPTAEREATRP